MKAETNRVNFAKHQIFCYVEDIFTCISDLLNPRIEELMNMRSHGLEKKELIIVLNELFSSHMLVALRSNRGLFTPTLEEIENALEEEKDFLYESQNTFYGLTSGAVELFCELKDQYQNET